MSKSPENQTASPPSLSKSLLHQPLRLDYPCHPRRTHHPYRPLPLFSIATSSLSTIFAVFFSSLHHPLYHQLLSITSKCASSGPSFVVGSPSIISTLLFIIFASNGSNQTLRDKCSRIRPSSSKAFYPNNSALSALQRKILSPPSKPATSAKPTTSPSLKHSNHLFP